MEPGRLTRLSAFAAVALILVGSTVMQSQIAFVSYIPVEALRTPSIGNVGLSLFGAIAVLGAGIVLFYSGLRRYESGNLLSMHG